MAQRRERKCWLVGGEALKLTGVYGVIQGKYCTFGRSDTLIPCGACSVPGANLALVITCFFQSKNYDKI